MLKIVFLKTIFSIILIYGTDSVLSPFIAYYSTFTILNGIIGVLIIIVN